MTAFLDTNILIYAAAQQDTRSAVARDLLRRRCTISVQVLNEFAAVAHRRKLSQISGDPRPSPSLRARPRVYSRHRSRMIACTRRHDDKRISAVC